MLVSDKAGRQPVHLAATRNHRVVIEFLYSNGLDLQTADHNGRLPVHLAARYGGVYLSQTLFFLFSLIIIIITIVIYTIFASVL